LNVKVNRRIS